MSTTTIPKAFVPLGHVSPGGQKLAVENNPEWMRAFEGLRTDILNLSTAIDALTARVRVLEDAP